MNSYLPKILITGGNGQLAHALDQQIFAENFELFLCSRDEMDITDMSSVTQAIEQFSPDIIINTAAYTAVDKAEQETEIALKVNHFGAKNVAIACQNKMIPLIHISTDYVFDGQKKTPYLENDAVNPINLYGKSKWLGEESVRENCEQHIILRVSGVFSEYGNNFFKTILRLAQERKSLRIVADQITCPTDASDIARVIFILATQKNKWGTYHFCSNQPISWHQFAVNIVNAARKYSALNVEEITAIPTSDYPTPAKRPPYSVLNCDKIKTSFAITPMPLDASIARVAAALLQGA